MSRIVSIGYEGQELGPLICDLVEQNVEILVDVRLNAISRRRGFSKTALREALSSVGIDYRHLRALGNPKENRPAFAGPDRSIGQERFRRGLADPSAQLALSELAALTEHQVVAVLCFERDELACHRHVVLEEADKFTRASA